MTTPELRSGVRSSTVAERGRALSIASIGILAVAAWLALWLGHGAGHGLLLHHGGHAAAPSAMAAMMFVGGWTVMTVAMMLPTSLPVVVVFQAMVENRADRGWLITLVVLGYLVAWSAFGAIAYLVVLTSQCRQP